jgi:hypothetical protein
LSSFERAEESMTELSYETPVIGEEFSKAAPKVDTGFENIRAWANGQIDSANLKAGGIEEAKLSVAVQALLNAKTAGLNMAVHEGSGEVKAGELFVTKGAGITATLPKAAANVALGVWGASTVKVAAGDAIYGDFVGGASELKLAAFQHLTLIGQQAKIWLITAGEPQREQAYSSQIPISQATLYEPNATRATFVSLTVKSNLSEYCNLGSIEVGGVLIGGVDGAAISGAYAAAKVGFICPPGVKFYVGSIVGSGSWANYLIL